mmetsp:Transcript_89132/g.255199  ORF Transcript_89132/g.255199 Transcript_89132/m.255199 type:complete len:209 (-) Transcript_89132:720-1346(-)
MSATPIIPMPSFCFSEALEVAEPERALLTLLTLLASSEESDRDAFLSLSFFFFCFSSSDEESDPTFFFSTRGLRLRDRSFFLSFDLLVDRSFLFLSLDLLLDLSFLRSLSFAFFLSESSLEDDESLSFCLSFFLCFFFFLPSESESLVAAAVAAAAPAARAPAFGVKGSNAHSSTRHRCSDPSASLCTSSPPGPSGSEIWPPLPPMAS